MPSTAGSDRLTRLIVHVGREVDKLLLRGRGVKVIANLRFSDHQLVCDAAGENVGLVPADLWRIRQRANASCIRDFSVIARDVFDQRAD